LLAFTIFPKTRIGTQRYTVGFVPHHAELAVEFHVALPRQTLVPEHLGGRHHHRAVGIVLALPDGCVADAHRTEATVTWQRIDNAFRRVDARRNGKEWSDQVRFAARAAGL